MRRSRRLGVDGGSGSALRIGTVVAVIAVIAVVAIILGCWCWSCLPGVHGRCSDHAGQAQCEKDQSTVRALHLVEGSCVCEEWRRI